MGVSSRCGKKAEISIWFDPALDEEEQKKMQRTVLLGISKQSAAPRSPLHIST
jgi:hypothetical protein